MHLHPLLVTAFTEECSHALRHTGPLLPGCSLIFLCFPRLPTVYFCSLLTARHRTKNACPVFLVRRCPSPASVLLLSCGVWTEKIKESRVHCLSLTCSLLSLLALTDFLWNCSFGVGAPHTRQKQQKKSYVFMIILQRKKVWRRRPIVRCPAITEPCVTNQIQSHLGFFFRICSST